SLFPFQTCRERLEGRQASSGRETQGRQSEAQARSSTSGGHRCYGCLRKAVEVKELTESLELVKVRSRAAVDRCNALTVDLERGREDSRQLESSLEEAKSESFRVQASLHELERENVVLRAQAAERASSSAAAALLQSLAAAAPAPATATAAEGGGMGTEQGGGAVPPVDEGLGTAFVRRRLEDACAKAVFAQRALDPERGLLRMGDELGAGGHGTVHQAVDPTTGKRYAVKTANDEEGKACLKEEAKNLIRLGPHEGVVEVEAIIDKDDCLAIAMELGQSDLQRAMFSNEHAPADLLR
ncbi:unnamed protein product, partial [Ectocarpus sp. 12 AP-2014]